MLLSSQIFLPAHPQNIWILLFPVLHRKMDEMYLFLFALFFSLNTWWEIQLIRGLLRDYSQVCILCLREVDYLLIRFEIEQTEGNPEFVRRQIRPVSVSMWEMEWLICSDSPEKHQSVFSWCYHYALVPGRGLICGFEDNFLSHWDLFVCVFISWVNTFSLRFNVNTVHILGIITKIAFV